MQNKMNGELNGFNVDMCFIVVVCSHGRSKSDLTCSDLKCSGQGYTKKKTLGGI